MGNNLENTNGLKPLIILIMFYMMIKVLTVVTIYRITNIYGVNISVSTLIIPFWFVCGDIIAEIWNFKVAKMVLLLAIIFQIIFALLIATTLYLPDAGILNTTQSYNMLAEKMFRVSIASSVGLITGGLYNAYLLILLRDKLLNKFSFSIRSIIASSAGSLIFTIIVYLIEFHPLINHYHIVKLIFVSFITKEIITPIITLFIASPIVKYIKNNYFYQLPSRDSKFKICELFTENGQSKFKDIVIETPIKNPLGDYSNNIKTTNMMFRSFPPGLLFDKHCAPQKQYIVYLSGQVEVTNSIGESRIFNAGDILLANDLVGEGHISKTLSKGKAIIIQTN